MQWFYIWPRKFWCYTPSESGKVPIKYRYKARDMLSLTSVAKAFSFLLADSGTWPPVPILGYQHWAQWVSKTGNQAGSLGRSQGPSLTTTAGGSNSWTPSVLELWQPHPAKQTTRNPSCLCLSGYSWAKEILFEIWEDEPRLSCLPVEHSKQLLAFFCSSV